MSPTVKLMAAIIALIVVVASTIWARSQPGFASTLGALSSLVVFLGLIADGEVFSWLRKKWPSKFSWLAKPLRKSLHTRFTRDPIQLIEFIDPKNTKAVHRVASYSLVDDHGTGLLKTVVHHPPEGDPYDILTTEGNAPTFKVLDLDGDGQPELFVDAGVGGHGHMVHVYRLSPLRFTEVKGAPLFADWGPVSVDKIKESGRYEISIKVGAGPAGSDAALHKFQLGPGGLHEVENEHA